MENLRRGGIDMKDSYRDFDQLLKEALEEKLEEEIEEIQKDKDLLEKYAPSQELEERMQELFYPKKRKAQALKRVAVFIILFLGLFSSLMVFNRDVQAQVLSFVERWLPDHAVFEFISKDNIKEKHWEITYIPKGYKFVNVEKLDEGFKIFLYKNKVGKELSFMFSDKKGENSIAQDNEFSEVRKITIKDHAAIVCISKREDYSNALIVDTDEYLFIVDGYIPEKELIKIGESIREKNN